MVSASAPLPWSNSHVASDLNGVECGLAPAIAVQPVGWSGHHEWRVTLQLQRWQAGADMFVDFGDSVSIAGRVSVQHATVVHAKQGEPHSTVLSMRLNDGLSTRAVVLQFISLDYKGEQIRVACRVACQSF